MSKEVWSIVKRFLRGFAAGGLANVALIISTIPGGITNFKEFGVWLWVLVVAFIGGGILALDKMLRYE